jgi:hypothetical protein
MEHLPAPFVHLDSFAHRVLSPNHVPPANILRVDQLPALRSLMDTTSPQQPFSSLPVQLATFVVGLAIGTALTEAMPTKPDNAEQDTSAMVIR